MTTLPTWLVVLLGLAGPIVALVALVVGWLSDRGRQEHERKLQRAELEDRRRKELRDERLKAYRRMQDITRTIDPTQPYEFNDLSEAFSEIELLTNSPAVLSSAWSLFGKANEARKSGRKAYEAGIKDVANHPPTRAAYEASQSLRLYPKTAKLSRT